MEAEKTWTGRTFETAVEWLKDIARVPCEELSSGELMALRRNVGPKTWSALERELRRADLCADGVSFLTNPPASTEYETPELGVGSIEKLMTEISCRRLRASVLKGIANRTNDPEVLEYLSRLDSSYIAVYHNHELRIAVAENPYTPAGIVEAYSRQGNDRELRDRAAAALRK
jgi:hypothetical protein